LIKLVKFNQRARSRSFRDTGKVLVGQGHFETLSRPFRDAVKVILPRDGQGYSRDTVMVTLNYPVNGRSREQRYGISEPSCVHTVKVTLKDKISEKDDTIKNTLEYREIKTKFEATLEDRVKTNP
jgi:hypothetical protein